VQLDRIAATLRPRRPFEAVDLGIAMLRRWFAPVAIAWLALVVPICAAVLVFFRDDFFTAMLLLWWLKPLFERVPLFVLSRALFGATPSLQETFAEAPRLYLRNFLLGVIVHRLHPARGMAAPVALLERPQAGERGRREFALLADGGGTAFLVGCIHFALEWLLTFQFVLLVLFLVPNELLPDFRPIEDGEFGAFEPGWTAWGLRACWLAAYSIVGPLNAACGFALYVNRRTQLEGWDIELAFRRLAARARSLGRLAAAGALLAALFLGARAFAQDAAQPASDAHRAAEQVLAHPDFDTTQTRSTWDWDFNLPSGPSSGPSLPLLARLLELGFWIVLAAILVALIVVIARAIGWIEWKRDVPEKPKELPTHAFGLDLRPETLPDDVAREAWAAWQRGDAAGALGLLYRAAIARLIERDGLELERSDTENDCLRRVKQLADLPRADYFRDVTGAWLACAYSPARPSGELVERLCSGWREHFDGSREAEAR
jgi:hypothetical protein